MSKETERKKKQDGDSKPKSRKRTLWGWVKSIGGPILLYLLIRSMVVETFKIPSGSMENTLLVGDFLFANKMLYGAEVPLTGVRLPAIREPRRNDLVVFDSPEEPGLKVVKRIVGMPGDTLRMTDNVLVRNGDSVREPWVKQTEPTYDQRDPRMRAWQLRYVLVDDPDSYRPTQKNWGPLVVPADSFFVMGDNRDNSYDSRYWGFLGRDRIEAHPMMVYYSFDREGMLPLPVFTSIRWGRIFSTPD